MSGRMLTMTAVAAVLGIGVGAVGVSVLSGDDGPGGTESTISPSILGAPDGSVLAAGLVQADSCADLAATFEDLAEEFGDDHGFGFHGGFAVDEMATDDADGGGAGLLSAPVGAEGAESATRAVGDTTNVQVVGVDEPDIVERVGRYTIVGTQGVLHVVDVVDGQLVELGELPVQRWGEDLGLFAVGDDQVAIVAHGDDAVRADDERTMVRPGGWSSTEVVLVDLADPTDPTELSRVRLEGWAVDSRAVDGQLRLALRGDGPQLDPYVDGPLPVEEEMMQLEREADETGDWDDIDWQRFEEEYQEQYEERMAEARAQLRPEDWQPHADVDGRIVPLVDCDRIGFPTSFAGLGTLTMTAIDTTGDTLTITDAEAVVTSGENLYATTDRLVVATTRWEPCCEDVPVDGPAEEPPAEEPGFEPGETEEGATAEARTLPMIEPGFWRGGWGGGGDTDLHVFDVDGGVVSHVASGTAPGTLINQYAMSIHEGVLRVATTDWTEDGTESFVTTFRVAGTDLEQLGQVGDLGPDEDIQAVRFVGDVGYVVTFRRTDPLYVVDLADPTDPTTLGELKIEGYSAYLHPIGDGQLLGVGQDADPETGFTEGVQVSTFDVTDPAAPSRIDVDVTPNSHSEVEWEPKALTFTEDRLAFVPMEVWNDDGGGQRLGVVVYRVGTDGELTRLGLMNSGSDYDLFPRRTVDLGDALLTVGWNGVIAWDRDAFEVLDTLRFATPEFQKGEDGDRG